MIRIVSPEHNQVVTGTVDLEVDVQGKHIARVEYYIDNEFYSTVMQAPYRIPWKTHNIADSTYHRVTAKVYDQNNRMASSNSVQVLVDNADSRPRNTLHLVRGYINTTELDCTDPMITVEPGKAITGDVTVRANNRGDPSWGAPLGGTPTWGNHIVNYWETGIWLAPGISEHMIDIFVQAPVDTGTYFIFIAWAHETDCSHVMALSYWRYDQSPEWNDGNDIADWTAIHAQMAIDSGYVRTRYRYDENGYGIAYVPATAIRVVVK